MIRGGLLTRYYLDDGIRASDAYRRVDPAHVRTFADQVGGLWRNLSRHDRTNEAETEQEFIVPVIDALGWHHLPQQEPGKGRRDVADMLLFFDAAGKDKARRLKPVDRFRLGAVVVENEARETRLDRASGSAENPRPRRFFAI